MAEMGEGRGPFCHCRGVEKEQEKPCIQILAFLAGAGKDTENIQVGEDSHLLWIADPLEKSLKPLHSLPRTMRNFTVLGEIIELPRLRSPVGPPGFFNPKSNENPIGQVLVKVILQLQSS